MFSAAIHGAIDAAVHDAAAIEQEIIADLEAIAQKYAPHLTGSWFNGSTAASTDLTDSWAQVPVTLPVDHSTGEPVDPASSSSSEAGGGATPPTEEATGSESTDPATS